MQTSESISKLMPALIKARQHIKPAEKSGDNKFDKYSYAKEEDWHQAVMPSLLSNDLVLAVSVAQIENLPDAVTKSGGTEHRVQVRGLARLFHSSGEWIEIEGVGQGQDRADKAAYKAITGMKKYLYAMLFALPTTDDPEADETVGRSRGEDRRPVQPQRNGQTEGPGLPVKNTPQFDAFWAEVNKLQDQNPEVWPMFKDIEKEIPAILKPHGLKTWGDAYQCKDKSIFDAALASLGNKAVETVNG